MSLLSISFVCSIESVDVSCFVFFRGFLTSIFTVEFLDLRGIK